MPLKACIDLHLTVLPKKIILCCIHLFNELAACMHNHDTLSVKCVLQRDPFLNEKKCRAKWDPSQRCPMSQILNVNLPPSYPPHYRSAHWPH